MAKTDTADPSAIETINPVPQPTVDELLAAPFDETFQRDVGGITLDYLTGEQVISRLNQVLGALGWDFEVVAHGFHQEADEAWAMGRIRVLTDRGAVVREQFGSQKIKRSRSAGAPMDIGFDLKGAATDALKKCAMSLGVGLYLSKRETVARDADADAGPATHGSAASMTCQECGRDLTATNFKDGTTWSPQQLAAFGRRKHQRVLCMDHYRQANELRRRAEQALEEVPF